MNFPFGLRPHFKFIFMFVCYHVNHVLAQSVNHVTLDTSPSPTNSPYTKIRHPHNLPKTAPFLALHHHTCLPC